MKKQSLFIILLTVSMFFPSALHAAARSDPSMFTQTACTQIVQEPDFNFELVSSDAKSFLINAEVAAEYSATLCSMREVRIALESQKLASGMTQVINVDVSSKFLSVLTTIINWANYQKQYLKTVSAWKLSNELDIKTQMTEFDVPDYQTFFALLDLYETKPVIADVVAIFTLQHLEKDAATFLDLLNIFASSPISKNALAKQMFLSRRCPTKEWQQHFKEKEPYVTFYTSVQDHIDHPECCLIWRHINDLTGIQHLAEVDRIESLNLGFNYITAIPANAFVDLAHLKCLRLQQNQITDIERAAFTGLTHLQELSLSYNRITHIASNDFVDLTELEYLFLSNNQLTSIAPGTFINLINLKYLDLMNNNITNLDERTRIEAEVKAASPNAKVNW